MSDARQFSYQGRASTVGGKELTGPITHFSSLTFSLLDQPKPELWPKPPLLHSTVYIYFTLSINTKQFHLSRESL